jgi:TonB family protein
MQQATPTRGTGGNWVTAVYEDRQRRRLAIAAALLLAAITAVLVRDGTGWFGNDNDQTAAAEGDQPAFAPSTPPPVLAPAAEANTADAAKHAAEGTHSSTVSHGRSANHLAVRPVKGESKASAAGIKGPSSIWGGAKTAAQRARASEPAQAHPQVAAYPLLTQATAVQGSVLLQALIAADGAVEEMRVISGPTILVSAARQAVQQWRFKPYLVNGKPVETYARVTVNFTIDVSNTEARYHVNSVTATGAF